MTECVYFLNQIQPTSMSFHHVCEGMRRAGKSDALASFLIKYGRTGHDSPEKSSDKIFPDRFFMEAENLVKFNK